MSSPDVPFTDGEAGNPSEHLDDLCTRPSHENIFKHLHEDILGADFLVGLFWAAMNSFRHDSILRPFPSSYVVGGGREGGREVEGEKDIEGLRQVFGSLPPLHEIASGKMTLSSQQTQLLHWILNPRKVHASSIQVSQLNSLLEKIDSPQSSSSYFQDGLPQIPKFIFELEYSKECEAKFQSIAKEHGTMFAFHGSSVDNFYSIVHNGLLNLFNKVSAFGEGNYLSTELSVCLNWSPCGRLWPQSCLPHSASCVALCELVKHPSVIPSSSLKRMMKARESKQNVESRSQVGGEPSLQQNVPEKYFVVKNDELVRVKYVFVFEMQKPVVRRRRWECQHKFILILTLYLVFLVYIGATQSKFLRRFIRRNYKHYFY